MAGILRTLESRGVDEPGDLRSVDPVFRFIGFPDYTN